MPPADQWRRMVKIGGLYDHLSAHPDKAEEIRARMQLHVSRVVSCSLIRLIVIQTGGLRWCETAGGQRPGKAEKGLGAHGAARCTRGERK